MLDSYAILLNMNYLYLALFLMAFPNPITASVTDLYVWRHGQTEANKEGLLSGGAPALCFDLEYWSRMSSLTEEGKQQANELAKLIVEKYALDVIYTSDLARAYDTANAVLNAHTLAGRSIKLHTDVQLREILHGKYELTCAKLRNEAAQKCLTNLLEQPTSNDKFGAWKVHPQSDQIIDEKSLDVAQYLVNKEERPETPWQLYNRITTELALLAKIHPQEKIGISTHGAVLATLLEGLNNDYVGTYVPPHYNANEIRVGDKVIPAAIKIQNCALFHFQYDHDSGDLKLILE